MTSHFLLQHNYIEPHCMYNIVWFVQKNATNIYIFFRKDGMNCFVTASFNCQPTSMSQYHPLLQTWLGFKWAKQTELLSLVSTLLFTVPFLHKHSQEHKMTLGLCNINDVVVYSWYSLILRPRGRVARVRDFHHYDRRISSCAVMWQW